MRKDDFDEIEDLDDWDFRDDYQEEDYPEEDELLMDDEGEPDDGFFDDDPELDADFFDEEEDEEGLTVLNEEPEEDPVRAAETSPEAFPENAAAAYEDESASDDDYAGGSYDEGDRSDDARETGPEYAERTREDGPEAYYEDGPENDRENGPDVYYEDGPDTGDYDDPVPERRERESLLRNPFASFGERKSPSRRHVSFRGSRFHAFWEAFDALRFRLTEMDRMDRIVALTGLFVAIIALATCSMYAQAQSVRKQVSSFSTVGGSMSDINVIGKAGISALADASRAKARKAEEEQEALLLAEAAESREEEEDAETGSVTVKLKVTTIQSDIKVKFVDSERGKLIEGVPFEAEAKSSEENLELKDDDQDGIIYVKNVKNGKYSVSIKALTGSYAAKYLLPTGAQSVNVTDTIAYKKVDVADEIKSESQVNAKAEDTAVNDTVVESSLTDTVAWVESTKTEEGEVTYVQTSSISIPEAPGGESESLSSNGENSGNKGGNALNDTNGNRLYYHNGTDYVAATWQDYWNDSGRAYYTKSASYVYTGWQTIGGYTYFFTADHQFVTGEQIIQGAKYNFDAQGHLQASSGQMGIDVSKWNGAIDWAQVKNSGVSFAIIRCGYRGSSTGALIEDPTFRRNISGAKAAGISVGVYFFTQAINEAEAVEEASMAVTLASAYGLNLPIYMDVESSGGRGDALSTAQRTAVCSAFLRTVQSSGYSGGIYGNKTWLTSKIATSSLTSYSIWLAQYAAAPTYTATRYDIWQYTSKGKVSGISGNVDMNIRFR